jgi:hypothetical protein
MLEDVERVKDLVRNILEKDRKARENDNYLIIKVWQELIPKMFVPYDFLDRLPQAESITRCRREFQSRGLFMPSPEITEKRQKKEREYHDYYAGESERF